MQLHQWPKANATAGQESIPSPSISTFPSPQPNPQPICQSPATSQSLTLPLQQFCSLKNKFPPPLNIFHCPTAISSNPCTPPSLYPTQALALLLPIHVSRNSYNTSPPLTALPLTCVFPRHLCFPQELSQHFLHLPHQRRLALRALTQFQQSS